MRALVVGGTGPTGPFIIEGLLKRGYDVTIFHRGTHEVMFSQEIEHLHGDPHFPETIVQALEGKTFDIAVVTYGRLRYLAEALKKRTKRFISVGGDGVYRAFRFPNIDSVPIPVTENCPLQTNPNLDKFSYLMALSEQIVMNAHREGHYVATHFRYTKVYGPRELAPTEWCIIRRVLDGRKQLILPCGGLSIQSRVYAENAAHALLLAVDHTEEAAGKIYNVSEDQMLSLRQWAQIVTDALGQSMELIDMPYAWARPSYPYIRIYTPLPQLRHWVVSNAKIKAELGYQDVVPAEEAIRHTVAWLLRNRLERDGEQEKATGDPFDYAAEDRLIEEYRKAEPRIMAVPFAGFAYRHPYAHPKRPEE